MTPQKRVSFGWKGVRPEVRLESQTGEPVKSPKNTSVSSCRCSTTSISWWVSRQKKCESSAQPVSHNAKRFSARQWSILGLGSEKKWYSTNEDSPQGEWDRIAEQMMLTFAESKHPVFRSTSPLSRGVLKSKGGGKLSIHFCADPGKIETVFRTSVSVNQLRIYGAVSDMCEECDTRHDGTGRPVLAGQSESDPSFVPSVMKTHILWTDDPLKRYHNKIE